MPCTFTGAGPSAIRSQRLGSLPLSSRSIAKSKPLNAEPPLESPQYLVISVGTTGDIHPFMRISQSLQAMGCKVTFITNSVHLPLLQGSGIECIGLGTVEDFLSIVQDPDIWHPRRGLATMFANYADSLLQLESAIHEQFSGAPLVAIAHPLAVPGAAIAREKGWVSKLIAVHLAPSTLRTCHDPLRIGDITIPRWFPMSWRRACWRMVERGWIDPAALTQTNRARQALGLAAVPSSFLTHLEKAPDLTVALFPTWFGPTMPDWPKPLISADFALFDATLRGEIPGEMPEELQAFLAAGEAPLVFTPGTGNVHAHLFFRCAIAATRKLGQRAVLLTKDRSQLPAELPAFTFWQPYVPLASLLPRAKALIHHGGIGTTAEALRAATPQLVTPFAWDQFDNAARVKALAVGLVLRASLASERRFTRFIRALISSDGLRERCQQVSKNFASSTDFRELCAALKT